jgi:hypothetical protein
MDTIPSGKEATVGSTDTVCPAAAGLMVKELIPACKPVAQKRTAAKALLRRDPLHAPNRKAKRKSTHGSPIGVLLRDKDVPPASGLEVQPDPPEAIGARRTEAEFILEPILLISEGVWSLKGEKIVPAHLVPVLKLTIFCFITHY